MGKTHKNFKRAQPDIDSQSHVRLIEEHVQNESKVHGLVKKKTK